MNQTLAGGIFDGTQYAWEALPKIEQFIAQIVNKLPKYEYEELLEGVWVGRGTWVESTALIKAPAIIGFDCEVRHNAFIRGNAIVGNGVIVGNATEVKNAIVFNGVEIPHYNYVGDSILGYKVHLGAGVVLSNFKSTKDEIRVRTLDGMVLNTGLNKFGAMLGDHVEIGCNSVLNPGTVVGRGSIVYPLSSVRGTIPANHLVKTTSQMQLVAKSDRA